MIRRPLYLSLVLATIFFLVTVDNAYAYLDSGTGSLILQLVLAGVGGIAVLVKVFWHRLTSIFGIRKDKE